MDAQVIILNVVILLYARYKLEQENIVVLIVEAVEEFCFGQEKIRGTERNTEGVGQDMSIPLKLFLVSGSLFSETSA